jgi:Zn-dependent protease with chaperone function
MRITVLSLALITFAGPAAAQRRGPAEEAFDARALEELRARDPGAAEAYARGLAAEDRHRRDDAARAYEEVVRLAPEVSHGYRAQARALFEPDDARSVSLGRRAVELERSAKNLAVLSVMLSCSSTAADRSEAVRLADESVATSPDEPWGYGARLVAAVIAGDDALARTAAADLERSTDPLTAAHGLATGALLAIYRDSTARTAPPIARELTERANELGPDDHDALCARAYLEAFDYNGEAALEAARRAVAVSPDSPAAYNALALAQEAAGDYDAAEQALEEAHARGLDDAAYESHASRLWFVRWFVWIALAVIVGGPIALYLGIVVFLLLAGAILSRLTLRAASRLPAERSGRAVGVAGWLRWSYRVVLWLACLVYYVSLPLLAIGIVLLFAGVVLAVLMAGVIPIKLILILGLFALVTVFAIVKSVFTRGRDEDPGPRLDVRAHPRFAAVLGEVADRVGTRPVDAVYLTAGTDIAVTERGGMWKQLRRKTERCLILGVGVLEGMSAQELKAILAHEHGHFKNEDTAGGSFALAVRRSMTMMLIGLLQGGVASKLNPAWLFTILFSKMFARISQGASRLQEVLADRWAAYAYGSDAFVSGLRHVIAQSVRFDVRAQTTLGEVIEKRLPLTNFYTYEAAQKIDAAEIDRVIEAELNREPTAYDSHPAPRDRIAWVTALGAGGEGQDDGSNAWSLFEDRDALERAMTDEIRVNVSRSTGVMIPGKEDPFAAGLTSAPGIGPGPGA